MREEEEKKRKNKKLLLALLAILALAGIIFLGRLKPTTPSLEGIPELPKGKIEPQSAADFPLRDLKGRKVRLSDFRGKAILINFWSVSCPACIFELQGLEELSKKMAGKDFALLAVTSDPEKVVAEFVKETNLKLDVYIDPDGYAHSLYGVYVLPVSIVIDPKGRVVDKVMGAADWGHSVVIDYFNRMLSEGAKAKETERSQGQ